MPNTNFVDMKAKLASRSDQLKKYSQELLYDTGILEKREARVNNR